MTAAEALLLGVVQGLTEFLPVSSSAHLALAPRLVRFEDPGLAFDVALHFGTLVALLWYFRAEWREMLVGAARMLRTRSVSSMHERRALFLIVATIPGGIGGLLLNDVAEAQFRAPALIATAMAVMGVVLWGVDRWAARVRAIEEITLRDAIVVGCAQVLALIPGVSRSGSTITAGRALGLDRASAARFSFLMSMPITAAAVVLKVPHVLRTEGFSTPLLLGVAAAAVSSALAIRVLLRFVGKYSYGVFAAYRVVVAGGVLTLVALGRI